MIASDDPNQENHHRRRLLQTPPQPVIQQQYYCYPSGSCDAGLLSNGVAGFLLQGGQNGRSVSTAGDINGDGLAELMVGAAGRAFVIFGSSNSTAWANLDLTSPLDARRGFVLNDPTLSVMYSVNTAGDVNGDGLADMIVGHFPSASIVFGSNSSNAWGEGTTLVSLMNGQRGFRLQNNGKFGASVASAGDINGDGFDDILIYDYQIGNVFVVFGTDNSSAWGNGVISASSLMNGRRGFVLQGPTSNVDGLLATTAGDINGDGLDDFIVGAFNSDKTYVIFGTRNSTAWGTGTLAIDSLADGWRGFALRGVADYSGASVSGAGDINGDGLDDIMVGCYTGKVFVVFRLCVSWSLGLRNC